jgi:hypothetical protein
MRYRQADKCIVYSEKKLADTCGHDFRENPRWRPKLKSHRPNYIVDPMERIIPICIDVHPYSIVDGYMVIWWLYEFSVVIHIVTWLYVNPGGYTFETAHSLTDDVLLHVFDHNSVISGRNWTISSSFDGELNRESPRVAWTPHQRLRTRKVLQRV